MGNVTRVAGLRELRLQMRALGADMAGKVARQATAAGAGVVRKAARRNAPVDTGALSKGLVMFRERQTNLTAEYGVTVSTAAMRKYVKKSRAARSSGKTEYLNYGDLFYGPFVEFGTVKMPARPFLRPALEDNIDAATEAIARRLKQRIDKVKSK